MSSFLAATFLTFAQPTLPTGRPSRKNRSTDRLAKLWIATGMDYTSAWYTASRCVGLPVGPASTPKRGQATESRPGPQGVLDQNRAIDNRKFVRALKPLPAILLREVVEKLRHPGEL
jgi:hypothetical protein